MAITLITNTAAEGNANTVTTTGIDTTGATCLIAAVASYSGGGTASVAFSDSKSNTWVPLPLVVWTGVDAFVQLFYVPNAASVGSSHTVTATKTGAFPSVAWAAFSGLALTAPLDQICQNGGAGTSQAPGTVTTQEAVELAITGVAGTGNPTYSINSSFSITDQAGGSAAQRVALAYRILSATGAISPTWSWSGSVSTASQLATFTAPATSGAGGGAWAYAG